MARNGRPLIGRRQDETSYIKMPTQPNPPVSHYCAYEGQVDGKPGIEMLRTSSSATATEATWATAATAASSAHHGYSVLWWLLLLLLLWRVLFAACACVGEREGGWWVG